MVNPLLKYMKIKSIINHWPLITILVLAAILRFWHLGSNPPGLTPDEASLGYNAYSILKTGKDEYGKWFPVIFKSFGDYKPGLYVYLTVPSVAVLGLNEFAVRLPSALAGVFSVFLIYLIVNRLFPNELIGNWKLEIGTLAAFIAALNPWSIYFSRGAWEVNVALTLTLAGIYFFLKSFEKQRYLITSSLFFALTLVTYQGAKLSTGIVVLLLVAIYWKGIFKYKLSILLTSLVVGLIISLPIIISLFNGSTGRLTVFSVFSYPRPIEYIQNQLNEGGEKIGSLTYYLFHSETLNFVRGILGRWFNNYSGRFLFFEGDWQNPNHGAPYSGVLTLADLILLATGVIIFIRGKWGKEKLFVALWLILAPLPAVLSRDEISAVRALNLAIPLIIILAFGLEFIVVNLHKVRWLVGFIYLISYIYFLDAVFVHIPAHDSQYWEYGYKQIVQIVTPIQNKYKVIKVQQSYAQPYIYFLFYQKYDPAKYQKQAKLIESKYGDVGQVEHLDNIYFAPIDWSVNRGESGTLFVADTIRIPPEDSKDTSLFNQIAEIKYLNGRDTAFRIIAVK